MTGAGSHGIRYFLENIIDPDAVTLRTPAGEMVIAKGNFRRLQASEKSLMLEGLQDFLGKRGQIKLWKFLTTN